MKRTEIQSVTYRGYRIAHCRIKSVTSRGPVEFNRWEVLQTTDGVETYIDQAPTQNQAQLRVDSILAS